MKITIENSKGKALSSLLKPEDRKKYVAAIIGGKTKDLNYLLPDDKKTEIDYLDYTSPIAQRIYEASFRYLIGLAIKAIDKNYDVRFFYNISRSIFCRIIEKNQTPVRVRPEMVEEIKEKINGMIQEDIPFERIKISKEEALAHYKALGFVNKVQVLSYRPEDYVHIHHSVYRDLDYYDYLYSFLVPSSGYLKDFNLLYYAPGFLLQLPRAECGGKIPPFEDEEKFAATLASTSHWAEMNSLDTVAHINAFVKDYSPLALIDLSEARFNNKMTEVGKEIVHSEETIKVIAIAGPSSSGKTSFANRLTYELMSRGLRPVRISCDNFYIPREKLPKGTSLESIEALDLDFFNDTLLSLTEGEEVTLPLYDFKSGLRTEGKKLKLKSNQPLIIEGIHALDERMTRNIADSEKFRIYIAPQPQVNIDNHSPLSMTDLRLLRRIARDARTRGSSAKETISMWLDVREGEFLYIYPNQENADYVFDSFLPYEPGALRSIVLPLLEKATPEDQEYPVATRLKQMIRYFLPLPITDIPCCSILREFVGGTCYKDAR